MVTSPSGILTNVIEEYDGRLWQKNDMVFQSTDHSFRAPLFTAYKCFHGHAIDTYLFDLIILWIINIFLLIILVDGRLAQWMRK